MFVDTTLLYARSFGTIFNLLGLGIPLLLFGAILYYWPRPYFRFWALNYLLTLIAIGGEGVARQFGDPFWLTWPISIAFVAASAYLISAAEVLQGRPPMNRSLGAITGLLILSTGLMLFAGQSFTNAAVLAVVFNVIGHVVLGAALLRRKSQPTANQVSSILGACTIFTGLWALAYIPLEPLHLVWLGSVVAGINHLAMGAGMLIFLMDDVTRRLTEQNERLRELDRLKSNFLATISHELRTPLTSIKAGTWLLQSQGKHSSGVSGSEILATIMLNTNSLIRLIENMLDYSSLNSGMMSFELEENDLVSTVHVSASQCSTLFDEKRVTLDLQLPEYLEATFDAGRIQQVLVNLLYNAVKFTPAGGHVTLTLGQEPDFARIEVSDTGLGIPTDQLRRIFDRFVQVDGSSTRESGGAGLGLAISKAIVEDGHHGQIWAESQPAQGSTFVMRLPLKAIAPPNGQAPLA